MAKPKPKPEAPLTETAVQVLLAERFAAPEYAFMPHVRNGTGYARRTVRTADALAMSLYPSRGLELHGFEIKSDRSDWLRELAEPEKAEEIAKFCDRWWIAVGSETIVQAGELPPTWGLLVPSPSGLRVRVEAPKLEAKPLDRLMLASILRRAADTVIPKAEIAARLKREYERGLERGKASAAEDAKYDRRELEQLKASVATFEKNSGIDLDRWGAGRIGQAVRFVLDGGLEQREAQMRALRDTAAGVLASLDEHLSKLPAAKAMGTEG